MRIHKKVKQAMTAGVLTAAVLASLPGMEVFAHDAASTIKGDNNSAEEVYTWYKVQNYGELQNLWEIYKDFNVEGWDGKTIPIQLVGNLNGTRKLLQSPGENNATSTDYNHNWNWEALFYCADNDSSYYTTLSTCNDLEGWTLSSQSDVVTTRGAGGCFYLEKLSTPHTLNINGMSATLYYELHTYHYENGTYSCSPKILCHSYVDQGNNSADIYFTSDTSGSWHGWNIEAHGYNTFRLYSNSIFLMDDAVWGTYWIEQKVSLKLSRYNRWQVHQGMVNHTLGKTQSWQNYSSYEEEGSNKYGSDTEAFEIWYGVPGIAKRELQRVDGNTALAVDTTMRTQIATQKIDDGFIVTRDQTLGLSPMNSYYISSGNTLTIQEGATLVVGRNCVLVQNGTIINNGTIIIQPGGLLTILDRKSGQGNIKGSGDVIIRAAGKMRINSLSIEGLLKNDGLLVSDDENITAGTMIPADGGKAYCGLASRHYDYLGMTASGLNRILESLAKSSIFSWGK